MLSERWRTSSLNGPPTACGRRPKRRVLNANYNPQGTRRRLRFAYSTPSMTRLFSATKVQSKKGVKNDGPRQAMLDYGFHPYTTAFPLIVPVA